MVTIILYSLLSILIIGIVHFLYFSLQEINEDAPRVVNLKKDNEKRNAILSHLKTEEREDNELEEYLKTKLSD